jgi:hypothetical protein
MAKVTVKISITVDLYIFPVGHFVDHVLQAVLLGRNLFVIGSDYVGKAKNAPLEVVGGAITYQQLLCTPLGDRVESRGVAVSSLWHGKYFLIAVT